MTIIWCMVPEIWSATDRIFCHSGPFFALLPPYGPRKSKFWKNEKNTWRYYHFTNINDSHMMYGSSDMECTDRIFSFFKNVFCPFIPLSTQKSKFWKTEKIVWRYHHFTHLSHKWQSYDVWLLRYRVQWTEFFVTLYHFLPFYPLTTRKIKIWKNKKKHLEILLLYTSVP